MDFLFLLCWSDFRELRKDDFSRTTQSDDGNDKDSTDWKKCAVILLSRLLLTLCELFGLKNEVPADQSYKYEKNTAGKSASEDGDDDCDENSARKNKHCTKCHQRQRPKLFPSLDKLNFPIFMFPSLPLLCLKIKINKIIKSDFCSKYLGDQPLTGKIVFFLRKFHWKIFCLLLCKFRVKYMVMKHCRRACGVWLDVASGDGGKVFDCRA